MKKIMFSDRYGLTQAVLDGSKTMTRRLVTDKIDIFILNQIEQFSDELKQETLRGVLKNSLYKVGEVIAVGQRYKDCIRDCYDSRDLLSLKESAGWKNKMYVKAPLMPHQIRITNIHVERLQDISDEDCLREGIIKTNNGYAFKHPNRVGGFERFSNPRSAFDSLINCVSGKGTWQKNPWVFVCEFELVK